MNGVDMRGAWPARNGRVTLWLARIAAVALAVIAVVTFGDVVGRYFFHAPFAFTVELTQMAMAIVVYFGVGLVTHEDAHISADVVTLRLPPRWRALFGAGDELAWRSAFSRSWCGGCGVQAEFPARQGRHDDGLDSAAVAGRFRRRGRQRAFC